MKRAIGWVLVGMCSCSAAYGQDEKPNEGPRKAQCDGIATLVSSAAGRALSRRYGPRYFLDLPRTEGRYNGITVLCPADAEAEYDQIEFHSASRVAMDKLLPLVGSVASRYANEPVDRSIRAAAACLTKARVTTDSEQIATGNLKITCRATVSGDLLQIHKRK
jgi:hypothetical protein